MRFGRATDTTNKVIGDTCKTIVENEDWLTFESCVSSLEAAFSKKGYNPTSLQTLGLMSMEFLRDNITDTISYAREIIKSNKSTDRRPLLNCLKICYIAEKKMESAVEDFTSSDYQKADQERTEVFVSMRGCEEGFKNRGLNSPLKIEQDLDFTIIVSNIVGLLLGL